MRYINRFSAPFRALILVDRFRNGLLALTLAAATAATGFAQSPTAATADTGTISGSVLDLESGKYLPNARVTLVGTNRETFTDDYGAFTLRNVPAGHVTVQAAFTGSQPVTTEVDVATGKTVQANLRLNPGTGKVLNDGTIVLDEFQVESQRFKNAQEIAINEERYSPTMKNVVSADAFGDIPDGNVGEFVKYIPGVQIDYGYSGTGLNAADNNATSISVRGFGPEFTSITVDGVPLTNASPASLTRAVGLDMMTINNASRVEVIKVPTPDMPSNSPGGSINLVTRSAFEYAKPQFSVSLSLNVNSEDTDKLFKKTPGPANKATYKTLPGVDFNYVLPLSSKLGIAVSGAWSKTFNENHRGISDYFYDSLDFLGGDVDLTPMGGPKVHREKIDGTYVATTPLSSLDGDQTLSVADPVLWRFQATDTPNLITRDSIGLKLDWRPTPSQKIAVGYTFGDFNAVDAQRRLQFNGKKGYIKDWGPDFTEYYSYTPAGTIVNGTPLAKTFDPGNTVAQTVTTRDRQGNTNTGYVKYDFVRGPWDIKATASLSKSRGSYRDLANGHFSELETQLTLGGLAFRDISEGIPGTVEAYDRDGNPLDWGDLSQWKAPSIIAKSGETDSSDQYLNYRIDVRRDLDFLPWDNFPVAVKTGYYHEERTTKKWGVGTGYRMTYYGPTLDLPQYQDFGYAGVTPGFGLPGQQWLSTYSLYDLWQENPTYFNADSDADMGSNWQSYVNQQKSLTESSDQFYLMFEGKAFKNRLNWVAGAREEIAKRDGYAPKRDNIWNYVKGADGTIYRDTTYQTGVRIDQANSDLFAQTPEGDALRASLDSQGLEYPDHPIFSKSNQGTFYEYSKRAFIPFDPVHGKITGKPTYTVSVAYDITKNLVARLSWNRQQAKPDFENGTLTQGGSQGIQISENSDPLAIPAGTITISNPNLKPWIANSYDFQLAYYTESGGKFAISPYLKLTKDFQETVTWDSTNPDFEGLLSGLGLDYDTYKDYQITTTLNGTGTARTVGYELEASQNLKILGGWWRHFQTFASFSHHYVIQQRTDLLTAKPTAGTTASGGLNVNFSRFSMLARALYIEERYLGSEKTYLYNGEPVVIAQYNPSELKLDLNLKYKLSKRYTLFLDARNVLNKSRDTLKYDKGGVVPAYAQHVDRKIFGVTYYLGVKAVF